MASSPGASGLPPARLPPARHCPGTALAPPRPRSLPAALHMAAPPPSKWPPRRRHFDGQPRGVSVAEPRQQAGSAVLRVFKVFFGPLGSVRATPRHLWLCHPAAGAARRDAAWLGEGAACSPTPVAHTCPGTGGTPRQPSGAVAAGCGLGWRGCAWRVHVALPVRAWEAGRGAEGGGCHATCARGPLPAGRMRFSGSCLAPREPGERGSALPRQWGPSYSSSSLLLSCQPGGARVGRGGGGRRQLAGEEGWLQGGERCTPAPHGGAGTRRGWDTRCRWGRGERGG